MTEAACWACDAAALERRRAVGYTAELHKEEATLPTSRLGGAQVKP
jgi:hypothetical protein